VIFKLSRHALEEMERKGVPLDVFEFVLEGNKKVLYQSN
jgi:hypothetical protein